MPEKYSDVLADWLVEVGYTHCFFVAGGNVMHLLDSCRRRFACVATVHEVAAGIAAEYFNAVEGEGRAFALVTAGPGLTNIVTALGGAFLESRELLVLGGQVKSSDLARGKVRQRGIQEVDGMAVASPLCVATHRIERPEPRDVVERAIRRGMTARKGPVFLEICLDAQGAPVDRTELEGTGPVAPGRLPTATDDEIAHVRSLLDAAGRPVVLIGGGVSRDAAARALPDLHRRAIPTMTTWNGIDRIAADDPVYCGRPNTWGQRSANLLLAQADLILALGTRLGLQQTGFNHQEFAPVGRVIQVDVDPAELAKGHPRVDLPIAADADDLLARVIAGGAPAPATWLAFCREVRDLLPLAEDANEHAPGYLDPFHFLLDLSARAGDDDVVIPCSSGGANFVFMETFQQRARQRIVSDKGSAAMGYGLSGGIGAALAFPHRRTLMIEGDGGFAQNMQELGTVAVNRLNLKVILFENNGYASIRMTQRNYFDGAWIGCDTSSGLGFPDWPRLFDAFGIPLMALSEGWQDDARFAELFDGDGPAGFLVPIDPEQTYFPKITSRMTADGSMESNPLHRMSPDLPEDVAARVTRHLGSLDVA
jgi:acetolactate synthase I/II/III large subunit